MTAHANCGFSSLTTMESSSSLKRKRSRCVLSMDGVVSKRLCTGKKSVRFSAETTVRSTFNYLSDCSSAEEEQQMRSNLWYQSGDFSSFLADRSQTIRIWRAVGGNSSLLEPHYCTRGLETFSEMLVNNDFQSLRRQHVLAVLEEQKSNDAERIAQASRGCTNWAVERAQKFARQDAAAASSHQRSSNESSTLEVQHPRPEFSCSLFKSSSTVPAFSLRQMMPQTRFSFASAASRESLFKMGYSPVPTSSMDVSQLRLMNMQFLRCLNNSAVPVKPTTFIPSICNTASTLDLLNEALRATSEL